MTQPSLSGFLARYPDFACVDHGLVAETLSEAALLTDESWGPWEEMGAMLYAAHVLSIQGKGDGPVARAFRASPVKSMSSGSHKVDYVDSPAHPGAGSGSPWSLTPYGRQFETLMARFSAGFLSVQ